MNVQMKAIIVRYRVAVGQFGDMGNPEEHSYDLEEVDLFRLFHFDSSMPHVTHTHTLL